MKFMKRILTMMMVLILWAPQTAQAAFYQSLIKTNFASYAQVNEQGFAYTIHADPDISSEITAIDSSNTSRPILLTFDDAPQPPSDALRIAQALKERGVSAIFLVNGMYLKDETGRQIVRQLYDMGFEIGNHTTHHPNLRELSYEEQYAEIKETQDLIQEITGFKARWFRPPFGKFNMDTINICNEFGLQLMTWSFGYDWMEEYQDGHKLAHISLNNEYLREGANILMHDLPWTADAIGQMVDGYLAQGFTIVDPYLIKSQQNATTPLAQE